MSNRLLMNLNGVPADELDEIHALLQSQGIDYYQTAGSSFGMVLPGLWVSDEAEFIKARQLLDQYARERAQRQREQREAELAAGTARSFADMFAEKPLRFTGYLLVALILLYAATIQFWISSR